MKSTSNLTDHKRVVEQGYDRVAHKYARLEGPTEWPRMRWLKKLLNRLKPGSSVLDLGCGSGKPADVEVSKKHQITGVDISQKQIDQAQQNVPNGNFLHGDAGSVAFPPGSFDAVVSFYTLEHIPRKEHKTVLKRICDWLKVGGLLLISIEAGDYDDVIGEWLGVPMFISCYDPDLMKQMITEAGFERLETAIEYQLEGDNEIPFLWVLGRKL